MTPTATRYRSIDGTGIDILQATDEGKGPGGSDKSKVLSCVQIEAQESAARIWRTSHEVIMDDKMTLLRLLENQV